MLLKVSIAGELHQANVTCPPSTFIVWLQQMCLELVTMCNVRVEDVTNVLETYKSVGVNSELYTVYTVRQGIWGSWTNVTEIMKPYYTIPAMIETCSILNISDVFVWLVGRFEVCGMIEMSPLAVHSRTVRVTNAAGELADTASALNDGTFCVHCKPGVYQFSVVNCLFCMFYFLHLLICMIRL